MEVVAGTGHDKTNCGQAIGGATSTAFSRRAASKDKRLLVVPDTSHYDPYDQPEPTRQAIAAATEFFGTHL